MNGYVYAIGNSEVVKFGFTIDPKRRYRDIRNGFALDCSLLGVVTATFKHEQELLKLLAPWKIRGELHRRGSVPVEAAISMMVPFDPEKHQPLPSDLDLRIAAARERNGRLSDNRASVQ